MSDIKKVCVYCASSRMADPVYRQEAKSLGGLLAENGITLVYGGGAVGSMGALAEGAITSKGKVVGIIPEFMVELEWANPNITELIIVNDMQERRKKLIEGVDAVIALPGGSGTLEELFEAITWKRLGFFTKPIIIVNTNNFYDPLIKQMEQAVSEKFMDDRHLDMWQIVENFEMVIPAIQNAPKWSEEARHYAAV